ncbi:hypothetical protein [Streptomyces sp. NBC_01462]|uniref:hypothetical protein n=1 Tax=Streptomyces sp. NBC_01462 TaxID=2903876 RepID=UPI002E37FA6A|nr:hypothetical protein [Streptomyces sp. NBC_01462]
MKPYGDGTAGGEVSYTVLIRPELDGTALPELPGTLILGEVFALAAEGEARPGAPFWMVAGAGDGEVRHTPGAVGVRVGPEHRDGAPPHWMMWPEAEAWPGPDPLPRLLLPREADTGTAELRLHGDSVTGTVRLWAKPKAGWPRPRRYTATVTGSRAPSGRTPPSVTAPSLAPAGPAVPGAAPQVPADDRVELRSLAQSLVLERRYAEARPLLARSAALYAASASHPGAWGFSSEFRPALTRLLGTAPRGRTPLSGCGSCVRGPRCPGAPDPPGPARTAWRSPSGTCSSASRCSATAAVSSRRAG